MNLPVTQKHFLSFSRKLFLSVISLFLVFAIVLLRTSINVNGNIK